MPAPSNAAPNEERKNSKKQKKGDGKTSTDEAAEKNQTKQGAASFIQKHGKITRGVIPDTDDDALDATASTPQNAGWFEQRRMKRDMQKELDEMLREQFQTSGDDDQREFGLLLAQIRSEVNNFE